MIVAPTLFIPEAVWQAVMTFYKRFRRMEAGGFLFGLRNQNSWLCCQAGFPKQTNRAYNYSIAADDLAALMEICCVQGFCTLAQFHSHPGSDVEHSSYDDEQIVSRNVMSLVIPEYGKPPLQIHSLGVHLFQDGGWKILPQTQNRERLKIVRTGTDLT